MKAFGRKEEIEKALSLLGANMALAYAEDLRVLCCGGSALCMLEILTRSTKDVDALAFISDEKGLTRIDGFSEEVETAIVKTARALGLAEDWFNAEASILLERGLPPGILERSARHVRHYGPCLTIHFVARSDQVALKLFAAMDPAKGRRHGEDLATMEVSADEMAHAIDWLCSFPPNVAFKRRLAFLVDGLGFPAQAGSIEVE